MRRQQRRAKVNARVRQAYKQAVKQMRQDPSKENLRAAFSELDKAAKKGVVHKNKADRLKGRLSKLLEE